MQAEKELADKIIKAALQQLKAEHQWTDDFIAEIEALHTTNSLSDILSVYRAFEETAAVKEGTSDD